MAIFVRGRYRSGSFRDKGSMLASTFIDRLDNPTHCLVGAQSGPIGQSFSSWFSSLPSDHRHFKALEVDAHRFRLAGHPCIR